MPHLFAGSLRRVEIADLGQCSCQVVAVGRIGRIALHRLRCAADIWALNYGHVEVIWTSSIRRI